MDWNKEFDRAAKKLGLRSKYQLARKWDIAESAIKFYGSGRRHPDAHACFLLAEANGVSPLIYITAAEEGRARDERRKDVWQKRASALTPRRAGKHARAVAVRP